MNAINLYNDDRADYAAVIRGLGLGTRYYSNDKTAVLGSYRDLVTLITLMRAEAKHVESWTEVCEIAIHEYTHQDIYEYTD